MHPRLPPLALLVPLAACLPAGSASAQPLIETFVAASSTDEIFEPYDVDHGYDEESSSVAGERLHVGASSCLDPCVVQPPFLGEADAAAETDHGRNDVDVYAESWSDGSNSSYHDEAQASSFWQDELTLTSGAPAPTGSIRATFRVEGSWQNLACFAFYGYLYDPESIVEGCVGDCCNCPSVVSLASLGNGVGSGSCESVTPWGQILIPSPGLPPLPDYGEEDGDVETTVTVELPLILDRPLRFGASLAGGTGGQDFSSLESGVQATVARLEVPPGVAVDSEANALAAYHAPEPVAGAAASAALLALLGLPRRRR